MKVAKEYIEKKYRLKKQEEEEKRRGKKKYNYYQLNRLGFDNKKNGRIKYTGRSSFKNKTRNIA